MPTKTHSKTACTVFAGVLASLLLGIIYLLSRTILFASWTGRWYETLLGVLLLCAELFILLHGAAYAMQLVRVWRHEAEPDLTPALPAILPAVAVVVPSYNEPLDVIEKTLIALINLSYSNKHVCLLNDTRYEQGGPEKERAMQEYRRKVDEMAQKLGVALFRRKWHHAKAGILNDFLDIADGRLRPDFQYTDPGGQSRLPDFKYLAIFDADQTPFPGFLEPLVARMESEPDLAFIQTPQYYINFRKNRVARAAGMQQVVFYEYICEGKGLQDAMMCCGTNVLFRRQALEDVEGFEQESVTEDFATSFKFHAKGWRSAYSSLTQTFGMGPEDLNAYLKQQFRWALGTVGMLRRIVPMLLRNPRALNVSTWIEYIVSSTYYLVGWAFLILVLCPVIYLLFDVPSYFARPWFFMLFATPYIALTFLIFLWTLRRRNYRPTDIILGQLLIAAAFPTYMKASAFALLNIKRPFAVTPKGALSRSLPLRALLPQIILAGVNMAAITWGIHRLIYEQAPYWGVMANIWWCAYHLGILSAIIPINNNPGQESDQP